MNYPFGPLVREPKSKRIIALDTEDDSQGNMLYGVLWYGDGEYLEAESTKEMRRLLTSRQWRGCLCVCVNMEYDLGSVFGRKWNGLTATFSKGAGMVIANLVVRTRKRTRKGADHESRSNEYLEFMDLRNLDRSTSVERLGILLGLPKLVEKGEAKGRPRKDLTDREWRDLKIYCRRDAEITWRAGVRLQDEFNALGGDMSCTIGKIGMTIWRRRYQSCSYSRMSEGEIEYLHRAYYGGRAEAFRVGKIRAAKGKWLQYADVNSMYPWAMTTLDLPHPDSFTPLDKTSADMLRFGGISHALVRVDPSMRYPPLPVLSSEWKEMKEEGSLETDLDVDGTKLIFPVGTFAGYWTNLELEYARSLPGVRVLEWYDGAIFQESGPYLKDFATALYEKRMSARTEVEKKVYKLVMNSLYGKFAQRGSKTELRSFEDYVPDEEGDGWETGIVFPAINPKFIMRSRSVRPPIHTNIIWSAMITSAARIRLHKLLVEYQGIYCDTDSIITAKRVKEGTGLGEIKVEALIEEIQILAPKHYRFRDDKKKTHYRVKGVPPRAHKAAFTAGGGPVRVSFERPFKIREALRQGQTINRWRTVTKTLTVRYDKRHVLEGGDTRPIVMKEASYG